MSENLFKVIGENIGEIMDESHADLTAKELAERSNISYSTLAPILRGERDFRISSLIALTEALGTSPNELLHGLYKPGAMYLHNQCVYPPKYYAIFLTDVGLTYCKIFNLENNESEIKLFPFSLFCTKDHKQTIEQIKSAINDMIGEINFSEIFLYLSVLAYEHVDGRLRLIEDLRKTFATYIIEPDWMPIHHSSLQDNNGIVITINNGYVISYSHDHGKTINKVQGYSFPISDEAGNLWLGCEAIKHAINVKEGVEPRSMLSDKVLSLVNSDLNLLATKAFDYPHQFFIEVAAIVKELSNKKDKAYLIVKKGFDNIWERINGIDEKSEKLLPVYLAGALAYLYEEFIPKERLVNVEFKNAVENQLEYAHNKLEKAKENFTVTNRV